MKDYWEIIRRNLLSPIVVAILILSSVLLWLGEYQDAFFVSGVLMVNVLLSIYQEMRAKLALYKLELLNAPKARRYKKDGGIEEIDFKAVVKGDQLELKSGDEVPADGVLTKSVGIEINESMLTGESRSIPKSVGADVFGATIVVSGSGIMEVLAVGDRTQAGKISKKLRDYAPKLTPLQSSIARAISYLTYGALLLSLIITVVYYLLGRGLVTIFSTVTSAAVVIVPEGLLLASSLLLAYGSLKLARVSVLPQRLSAIEAMALVNILCVDKTGTLTENEITFDKLETFNRSKFPARDLISIVANETRGTSQTGQTIAKALSSTQEYELVEALQFSSQRKYSAVDIKLGSKEYQVALGAPEVLAHFTSVNKKQNDLINKMLASGKRLLIAVAFSDQPKLSELEPKAGSLIGLIILSNRLRPGVKRTVRYLQSNNVSLRVISGDNLQTVSYIARQAGIKGYKKAITGDELTSLKPEQFDQIVKDTVIFARILPDQKERLINAFRQAGHYTGMIGDGVNDALALKSADLGIAMYAGAPATRRLADLVLLDNSFNALPGGMRMGSKIIQSIELVATLFFHKITYGIIILFLTMALGLLYPFLPRHITFMNLFLVTMPTIMWTIFVPSPQRRLSPKHFWRDTWLAVAPIAAISGLVVTISYWYLSKMHPGNLTGVRTTTVLIATFFGITLTFLATIIFNLKLNHRQKIVRLIYILITIVFISTNFAIGFIRDFYDFTTPAWQQTWPLSIVIILAVALQFGLAKMAAHRQRKK